MRDRYPEDYTPRDRDEYGQPDRHPDDGVQPYDDDWRENDHQAGVWIKESQSRLGYSEADLIDVERYQSPEIRSKLLAVMGSIAALMLLALLAWSTLPKVTPSEIIASSDYGKAASAPAIPVAESTATPTTTTLQVIPANNTTAIDQQNNSATANSDNANYAESDTVDSTGIDSASHRVRQRWSNVRETPDIKGSIVVSLDINTPITVLSQTGEWFEILTADKTVGYMHRSTIAAN